MNSSSALAALLFAVLFLASCGSRKGNGESIYLTGSNDRGALVASNLDRSDLKDKAMLISCATCHGEDRAGRRNPVPDLGPFSAPEITAGTLLDSIDGRRPAYTRESLIATLRSGRKASGRGMHYPMPRWELDDKDAGDLADFLLKR
jgi:cytochrome c553